MITNRSWLALTKGFTMITLTQITQLALIGTPEATAQAKVLFELLNTDSPQDFTQTAKAIDKLKEAKATKELSYKEKMALHAANKKAGKATKVKATKAPKGKIGTGSKGNLGKASQKRNNHSKAKIAAYKAGITVPELIIGWFGKKKSLKTIIQIAEGTGLSNKEVGDTCWGQVNKGIMKGDGEGSYGMA